MDCSESLKDLYQFGSGCIDKLNGEELSIKVEIKKQSDRQKILIDEMELKHDLLRENVCFRFCLLDFSKSNLMNLNNGHAYKNLNSSIR
jgi:hypothetical protein